MFKRRFVRDSRRSLVGRIDDDDYSSVLNPVFAV